MIIFIDEERAYRYWITHHRSGFVLDGRHRPKFGHFMLHRATCAELKSSQAKRSHDTTGGRMKACAANRAQLESWVTEETGCEFAFCAQCQPTLEPAAEELNHTHTTKLGRDVLDYIVESAVIHMEWPAGPQYRLTVGDVARCMDKTVGQISTVLHTLVAGGLVTVLGRTALTSPFLPNRLVLPTAHAVKSLPGFAEESVETVQAQLDKLAGDET
jgi:hypothetical protein